MAIDLIVLKSTLGKRKLGWFCTYKRYGKVNNRPPNLLAVAPPG